MGKTNGKMASTVQAATHHLLPTAADAAGFPRPFLDFAAEVPRTHRGRRDDLCGLRALVPVAHHLAGIVESSWREMGTSNEPPQNPGNIKHVRDGHWFVEIFGNDEKKKRGKRCDLPK